MSNIEEKETGDVDESQDESSCATSMKPCGRFRKNTPAEKKSMRNARRRRLRKKKIRQRLLASERDVEKVKRELEQHVKTSKSEIEKANSQIVRLKCMTRTFWERWRWEVEKRKEEYMLHRRTRVGLVPKSSACGSNIHQIDPCLLLNSDEAEHYLGRGSFGIVTYKVYRGIGVAVKQMHIRSKLEDVEHEATMLDCLCHPFLPYLFGICTATKPFKIVTQFQGIMDSRNSPMSVTVRRELDHQCIGLNDTDWISTCAQILEALDYLHNKVGIIHNDITSTNILLGNPTTLSAQGASNITGHYQVLLTDFGKATKSTQGKILYLSHQEKSEYLRKFPQIPPEVIEGQTRQSTFSDMYAVGGILYCIAESGRILTSVYKKTLLNIAEECRLIAYSQRLSAKGALLQLQEVAILK